MFILYIMKADGYSLMIREVRSRSCRHSDIIEDHNLEKEVSKERTEQSFCSSSEIVDNDFATYQSSNKKIE